MTRTVYAGLTTTWLDENNDGVRDNGKVNSVSRSYDTDGRLDMLTYPESPHHPFGLGVTYHYTVDGHLKALRRADTGNLYWQAEAVNAAGQLTRALAGNGVTTYREYDAATGLPDTFRSRTSLAAVGVNDVQDLEYAFDTLGNLTGRTTDTRANGVNTATYSETFSYDNRNRLTQSRFSDGVTTPVTRSYRYDALGNLTHKSDVSTGNYVYGTAGATCTAAGPHAVAQVGAQCLTYDANGNQTGGYNFTQSRARTLIWTAYNKPRTIREGAITLTFAYGADRARFKQVNNATHTTTWYVGGLYEKQVRGSTATYVHYLKAGGQTVAIYRSNGTTGATNPVGAATGANTRYLHTDHLGSVSVITDERQAITERLAYDAWGKRRPPTAAAAMNQLTSATTLRGYTGHEMLDSVSLIHMNGRVYDPDLGRFLSADPVIQFPGYSQSYNRYSYVLNNPLSYTDPSGFFFKKLFKGIGKLFKGVARAVKSVLRTITRNIRTIAAIGVLFIPGVNAYAAGFVSGLVASGGDLKAGLINALTAGAFEWVGGVEWATQFGDVAFAAKAVAHGVVGGVSSLAQGGGFLGGFAAGGVAQFVGGGRWARRLDRTGQGVVRIVAGGLASLAGGGKFKNGAMTAAYAYAFNELRHRFVNPTGKGVRGCDEQGCGGYNASRGSRSHRGTDYSAAPGQDVLAISDGIITKIGYPYGDDISYRYIQIDSSDGYQIREFYITPNRDINFGSSVRVGQVIGTAQSLQPRYPNITDHIHVEIRLNEKLIDPASVIP